MIVIGESVDSNLNINFGLIFTLDNNVCKEMLNKKLISIYAIFSFETE